MSKGRAGHPPEVKAKARAVYEQHGSVAASQATSVPVSTIRNWASEERWQRRLPTTAEELRAVHDAQSAAIRIGWGARKRALGDEAGQAAAEALVMFRERVQARKVYGLEPLARSFSLLVERAEQMTAGTGGATSVTQAESDARLREIVAGLAERQAARDA